MGQQSFVENPALFWRKVDIRSEDECWPWLGCTDSNGYGRAGKGSRTAHRIAFQLTHGITLESSEFVLHECDNPPCCNPEHLFQGNAGSNARDMANKGRVKGGSPQIFDRLKAQELLDQGLSIRAVARELGVSHSNLLKTKKRGQINYERPIGRQVGQWR